MADHGDYACHLPNINLKPGYISKVDTLVRQIFWSRSNRCMHAHQLHAMHKVSSQGSSAINARALNTMRQRVRKHNLVLAEHMEEEMMHREGQIGHLSDTRMAGDIGGHKETIHAWKQCSMQQPKLSATDRAKVGRWPTSAM